MSLADYQETEPFEDTGKTINLGIAEILRAPTCRKNSTSEKEIEEVLALLNVTFSLTTDQKIMLTASMLHDLGMIAKAELRIS